MSMDLLFEGGVDISSLLDWPYSDDPKVRTYAKMLAESYEAMQREEEST